MNLFSTHENRVKCGHCNSEFDLNRNNNACPMCGFGKSSGIKVEPQLMKNRETFKPIVLQTLKASSVKATEESQVWGSWLMFNDFFAPKFICRILALKMQNEKKEWIVLKDLMNDTIAEIKKNQLQKYKGFPNLEKDSKGTRLVYHFLVTFYNMGLIDAKTSDGYSSDTWLEKWDKILVTLSKDGHEFAQLENNILDNNTEEQILTPEEKNWILKYLSKIDSQGYKEYSVLKEVYEFLKRGNNGNADLWEWFENNQKHRDYIKQRSKKARSDLKIFQQQLSNYAKSFSSAKISLLRELGVVKDKRNDYTIIGEFK